MVKIQVEADALAGSNCAALRQTDTIVSWVISSANAGSPPRRAKYDFRRGAKWRNSVSNAARSCAAAMRTMQSAISAEGGRGPSRN